VKGLVKLFNDICGVANVSVKQEDLINYGRDCTLNLSYPFDILLKPGTVEEVSEVVKVCNEYNIPITPRGGGSGVTGGALPVNGGVVLSLERFDRIMEINEVEGYILAESGVITAHLCDAVEKKGWYFPVAPSSKDFSFIGGNVA